MTSLNPVVDQSVKIVLLGDSHVGKSSLALRFTRDEFRPYCESTIGATFMSKTIDIPIADDEDGDQDGKVKEQGQVRRIEFKLWDTAGQEKYHSLAPMYYRNAAGCILVYDISNRGSFEVLKKWVIELKELGPPNMALVLCGNKSDLETDRKITVEEAKAYAKQVDGIHLETSARDSHNVQSLFVALGKRIPISTNVGEGICSIDLGQRNGRFTDCGC